MSKGDRSVEMPEHLVSVIDVANDCGKHKAAVFKVLKRLGIEPTKIRSLEHRGQFLSYITRDDIVRVMKELRPDAGFGNQSQNVDAVSQEALAEEGVFYLLQLEPDHDPGRIKLGFAVSLAERLRALRCSAPFTKVVKSWPCKRVWRRRRLIASLPVRNGFTPRSSERILSNPCSFGASAFFN